MTPLLTKQGPTLQKTLDFTVTRMGSRLLRMSLLQPCCYYENIQARLVAVQGIFFVFFFSRH